MLQILEIQHFLAHHLLLINKFGDVCGVMVQSHIPHPRLMQQMEAIISHNSRAADNSEYKRFSRLSLILIYLTIFSAIPCFAKDYSFSWAPNDGQVEGYKLYYKKGGSAGPPFDGYDAIEGGSPIIIPDITSFTICGLEGNATYHFALTAYNGANESAFTPTITVSPGQNQQERIKSVVTIINTLLLTDNG